MTNFLKRFRSDEDGAITVDWIVLTAGLVGLTIAVLTSVGGSVADSGDDIARCQQHIENVMARDDWAFDRKMRVIERRCGRV